MPEKIVLRRYDTYTEILMYLDDICKEFKRNNVSYRTEVWYNELFNSYKVYVIVKV